MVVQDKVCRYAAVNVMEMRYSMIDWCNDVLRRITQDQVYVHSMTPEHAVVCFVNLLQAKFGIPIVAQNQLEIYTTAVLLASVKPPSTPREESWRDNMNMLGELSCRAYRLVQAARHQDCTGSSCGSSAAIAMASAVQTVQPD